MKPGWQKKIGKGPGYYTHRHMRSPPMQCVWTETRRKTHTAFAVTIAWATNLRPSKLDSPQRWWECVCGWFSWKNGPKSSQQTKPICIECQCDFFSCLWHCEHTGQPNHDKNHVVVWRSRRSTTKNGLGFQVLKQNPLSKMIGSTAA